MIGDEYLQIRAQLGTALFSLSTLAYALHPGREILQQLQEMRASLREPFLVIALGDGKAGKSSLLDALFGCEMFGTSNAPADRIRIYRYGTEEEFVPGHDHLTECLLPNTLLRDFNVVDTPGTDLLLSGEEQHIIQQLLQAAELVLFVFSTANPWAPSTWELIQILPKDLLTNAVFVLQQCDQRDDFEVQAVTRHLEQTIHERISTNLRVFPVSAKLALFAKTEAIDKEGLYQQSNFGALESYINDTIAQKPVRFERLKSVCSSSTEILRDVAEKVQGAAVVLRRDLEKIGEFQHLLSQRKEQSLRHSGGFQWTLADSYERLQKRGEEILSRHLSLGGTLKSFGKSSRDEFQQSIDAEVQESVQRQILSAVELLRADLKTTWLQLHDALRDYYADGVDAAHIPDLGQERIRLTQETKASLTARRLDTDVNHQMNAIFRETAEWLKIPETENLNAVVASMAWLVIGDFTKALTEAASSCGNIAALMKRGRIVAQFRGELARKREELLSILESQLRNGIEQFYQEASEMLLPLQTFCAVQKAIYDPRLATVKQMTENFDEVVAKLASRT